MPLIYNSNNDVDRKMYLRDLYDAIILKDIVERNNIKDINLVNRIIQFMMENIGGILSSNLIAGYLKNEKNINISRHSNELYKLYYDIINI